MENMIYIISAACFAATFILTVIFSKIIIPILKSRKMGQKILEIGPRWHKSKEGTPTMGGITFIFAMTAVMIAAIVCLSIVGGEVPTALTATFIYALFCGFIGCIDDSAKLRRKQNEGLTAIQKLILQIVAASAYTAALVYFGCIGDSLYIPYFNIWINDLGIIYYLFVVFMLVGVDNAVNLTDGIDGLASSQVLTVAVFFIVAAFTKYSPQMMKLSSQLGVLGACIAGGALGFLIYNFHPARVFMGDTGSLFFGALVMGGALIIDNPLIVLIYGIMFIIEAASVMIQVLYFKLTHGKRFFRMAPIHHHFEKCGWGEVKIVVVFTLITAIFCVLAYFGLAPALSGFPDFHS